MLKAPTALASVQPLLSRASEMRVADIVVAYYSMYLAVKVTLESKLHTSDPEVATFAETLLNEVEKLKSEALEKSDDVRELLDDDEAARAHVLNVATSIFDKAEAATLTGRVTRATGAGFAAAAVFLGLEAVWNPVPPETHEKIKFAKFQAARILKAIRDGEDPNELFPKVEEEEADEEADEEEELKELEEVAKRTSAVGLGETNASAAEEPEAAATGDDDVTFPAPPHETPISLPTTPRDEPFSLPEAPHDEPEGNTSSSEPALPRPGDNHPEKEAPKPVIHRVEPHKPAKPHATPAKPAAHAPAKPAAPAAACTPAAPAKPTLSASEIVDLTKTTAAATKHAKFAISALNYDDIPTAVKQFESALATLKLYQDSQK